MTVRTTTACTYKSRRMSKTFYMRELSEPRPFLWTLDQAAHLESQLKGHFARKLAIHPNYGGQEPHRTVVSPRHLIVPHLVRQ